MSDAERLDAIEARANAATEGPWLKDPDSPDKVISSKDGGWDGRYVCTMQRDDFDLFEEDDAEFIAHARQDVPALVAALRAVLDEHRPIHTSGSRVICPVCASLKQGAAGVMGVDATDYPCPTVRAIESALGGAS